MVRRGARVALVALAAAAALIPTPAALVERYYSLGVYPPAQRLITGLSNRAPFALVDGLLVAGVVAWQPCEQSPNRAGDKWRFDSPGRNFVGITRWLIPVEIPRG